MEKMTKREVLNLMLGDVAIKNNSVYVGYITHELELLDKKVSKSRTNVEENNAINEIILDALAKCENAVTISELQASSDALKNYVLENGNVLSNQKLTYLLKGLVAENKVVKVEDKKKTFYSIAK